MLPALPFGGLAGLFFLGAVSGDVVIGLVLADIIIGPLHPWQRTGDPLTCRRRLPLPPVSRQAATSGIGRPSLRAISMAASRAGSRSAGHSTCDDGLVIDLSGMKGIRIDPERRRAHAQPGVVWKELGESMGGAARAVGCPVARGGRA
jgi:hypothetical protein